MPSLVPSNLLNRLFGREYHQMTPNQQAKVRAQYQAEIEKAKREKELAKARHLEAIDKYAQVNYYWEYNSAHLDQAPIPAPTDAQWATLTPEQKANTQNPVFF